ncbi:conserved hypothetical protein [Lebetimonas natsushimae]|uniref:Outer membrane protein beta-barrel domain-containing protein n=1 Tax=Lebetimonas natsushimae TaxID=1936991 RepID=A0A292YDZ1_9BACT|nr:hypothetical protein [Lebetimonas natsushimae]GAX87559.1 conserved hypothetical protein [Lebetimonas natsushimae]
MKRLILVIFSSAVLLNATTEFYTYSLKLNYKEYVNGNVVDKDYSHIGNILGLGIKYSNTYIFNYYLKGEYSGGGSYYTGADWSGYPVNSKQNGFYLLDLEAGFGKYFIFFAGYREWNRGKSNNSGDYNEKYYWNYIGFKYTYKFNFNKFYFLPEAGYTLAIDPKLKVKLGNEPTINLGNTTGGFIEAPFYFKYNKNIEIKVFYKYEYWHINASNAYELILNNHHYLIFEPESITENQYFGIGINFKF